MKARNKCTKYSIKQTHFFFGILIFEIFDTLWKTEMRTWLDIDMSLKKGNILPAIETFQDHT